MKTFLVFITMFMGCSFAQRPPYAGSRPIGYPEMDATSADPLGNRFGEDGTTERLPIEALGDRDLVNRISKLPIDQQPFWYINWKALEEHRKNPQTYPQKESPFIENLNTPQNQGTNQPSIKQQNTGQQFNNQGNQAVFQGGFPQRLPQGNDARRIVPQVNQPQTENRFGLTGHQTRNQNRNSGSQAQINTKPVNSNNHRHNVNNYLGRPLNNANGNEKQNYQETSTNRGDIDHIIGMPHNDTKRNVQMNQNEGKRAVQDFSKYFMART